MRFLKPEVLTASVVLVLFWSVVSFADVVVEIQTTENGSADQQGTMFVSGERVKISGSSGESMIFRGDKDLMLMLDPNRKEYIELSKSDIDQVADQMNGAMKQLEAQLANVPPEQRAMMENMMKGAMQQMGAPSKSAPPVVRATGEMTKVSGYSCEKVEVSRDGELVREYCVASSDAFPGGEEVRKAFDTMENFTKEMLESLSSGPFANIMESPFSEFNNIKGIPVLTRMYKDGQLKQESVLKGVSRNQIDPQTFEAPAGYTQKKMSDSLRQAAGH